MREKCVVCSWSQCAVGQDEKGGSPKGIDQLQLCCARVCVCVCVCVCVFVRKCLKPAPACLLCTPFSSAVVSWEIC